MGMFDSMGFGGRSNPTEQKKDIYADVERERNRYQENMAGLNRDVSKKGGWAEVAGSLVKGVLVLGMAACAVATVASVAAGNPGLAAYFAVKGLAKFGIYKLAKRYSQNRREEGYLAGRAASA